MSVTFTIGKLFDSTITSGYLPRWVSQVYTTDLNQDGNSDLVVLGASYPADGSPVAQPGFVAFGDGKGGFTLATETQFPISTLKTVHPREVVFADLNGDGKLDVFIANHGYDATPFPGEQNRLYLSNADGTWRDATALLPQVSDFSHGASAGDINGDGYLDLVVGNVPMPNIVQPYVMMNDGSGRFTRSDVVLPTAVGQVLNAFQTRMTSQLLSDLDQDGRADLVVGSFDSTASKPKPPFVLWNSNGVFSESTATTLPLPKHFGSNNSVYDIQSVDLNGDGRKDLIVAYQKSVVLGGWEIQVLINEGNRSFSDQTAHYIPEESAQFGGFPSASSAESQYWLQFINLIDLNSDGRMDFVLDARGSTPAPANLPFVYVQQVDGSFQVAKVSELAVGMSWFFDYTARAITWSGQTGFVKLGFENGVVKAYTLPATFAAVLPVVVDFLEPVKRFGTPGDDSLYGGAGNDTFKASGGNDSIDGGKGVDSALYSAILSNYTVAKVVSNGVAAYTVKDKIGTDGTDTLVNVERLQFTDKKLALDLGGNAGQVVKILGAVFGPSSVANTSYVGIGLSYLDTGMSYANLMQLAIDARLGGRSSNTDVVNLLYTNVVGSAPDSGSLAFYKGLLDDVTYTQGSLGVLAADSSINTMNINLVGLVQTGVEFV